ncbi:MAG: extracellular solute-binding protein [Pseudobutyrivibrio ruminis]|nr:extracellular solute-binding protein [Pseudobutyrivibrio ruminis]
MKKKIVSALLVSTMVATAFAGCGSTADEATDSAQTQSTTETADSTAQETSGTSEDAIANLIAATDGTVNIDLWCSETEEYQTVMKKLCDDFEAQYPDVDFNITLGAVSEADMKDRVLEDVEAAADVFVFPDDQLEALVKAGALNEVAAQYTFDMNDTDTPATVEAGQYNGKQYGYPFTASNGYFLYYDSSQLSDEDVASWEALTAKADELGKEVGCEIANGWYLYGFFKGAGCELSENEDQSNNCDWNSATGLAAAESLQSIAASNSFKSYGNDDLLANLNDGKVIAYVSGTWNVNAFSDAYGDGYAATKLPTFDVDGKACQMASYSGYKFVGVNAYAENTGWSMLLAEYLTQASSQEAVYEATGEGPSNTEALSSASSPALDALAMQSEFAELQRVGGNYWSPAESLGKNILDGKVSQQVLDDAVAGITQAVTE